MEAPNPFTERGPIRDPKRFFGRKAELTQIFERLATMQSVSIVGERRIGKSSLLTYITATGGDRLGKKYEFFYLDLQRVESTEDFIVRVLDTLGVKEGKTVRDFEKAIEDRLIVLCLDEFEQAGDFSVEFFNVLRSLASTGHLALVTASQTKLADLASEGVTTSPFFNIFTTIWLTELSEDECGEVLNGLATLAKKDFAQEHIAAAYQATQGNPWKLQIYGYYLYQTDGDLSQTQTLYQTELSNTLRPTIKSGLSSEATSVKPTPITTTNSTSTLLLILAAVIGFFSVLANFSLGIGVTVLLVVASLVIELARSRPRRGSQ